MSAPVFEHGTESATYDMLAMARDSTALLFKKQEEDFGRVLLIIENPPDANDADLEDYVCMVVSYAREIERRELEGEKN